MPIKKESSDVGEGPSVHVSLVLRGFTNSPAELTALLGLKPRRTATAGEQYLAAGRIPTGRVIKEAYWALGSDLDHRASLVDHIVSVLEKARVAKETFKALPSNVSAMVHCTVIPNGDLPLFALSPTILGSLAEFGFSLALDIVSVEDGEEDT